MVPCALAANWGGADPLIIPGVLVAAQGVRDRGEGRHVVNDSNAVAMGGGHAHIVLHGRLIGGPSLPDCIE